MERQAPRFFSVLCFILATLVALVGLACKPRQQSQLSSHSSSSIDCSAGDCQQLDASLWLPQKLSEPAAKFYRLIAGEVPTLADADLRAFLSSQESTRKVSQAIDWSVEFRQPFNKPVVTPRRQDASGQTLVYPAWYKGIAIDSSIYVLRSQFAVRLEDWNAKNVDLIKPEKNKAGWVYLGRFARSILENKPFDPAEGAWEKSRSLTDKTMQIVETKYTTPEALGRINEGVELLDMTARFIPGYAGAHSFVHGEDSWENGLGLVMIAADVIPLAGNLKNINKLVQAEARSFILVGAAARLANAGKNAIEGQATSGTGVDAFFAVAESGVYLLSRVKVSLKTYGKALPTDSLELFKTLDPGLSGSRVATVLDDAGAERLSQFLGGRSAQDIRTNGLSVDEVLRVVENNPKAIRSNGPDGVSPSIWTAKSPSKKNLAEAELIVQQRRAARKPIKIDIGGEGRYPDAININPNVLTTATDNAGRTIPNRIEGLGEVLPFRDHMVDEVIVESTPLRKGAAEEISRVIRSGGTIRLSHPTEYAVQIHPRIIEVIGGSHRTFEQGTSTITLINVP